MAVMAMRREMDEAVSVDLVEPAFDLGWYVCATEERCEGAVAESIRAMGLDVYWPKAVRLGRVYRRRRAKPVVHPLFPGYVFVRVTPGIEVWHLVCQPQILSRGSLGLLCNNGSPMRARARDIERLKRSEEEGEFDATRDGPQQSLQGIRVGDWVQVLDGPFGHFEGVVTALQPARQSVVLDLHLFGQPTSVTAPVDLLALLD